MTVTKGLSGRRAAAVLAVEVPALGRKAAKELIAEGRVLLDGKRLRKDRAVSSGAILEIEASSTTLGPNTDVEFEVLFENRDCLVVNKPAGMACHPLRAHEGDTLANGLMARFPEVEGIGYGALEPGLVNRIDVDTSGVVLVARNTDAFNTLREGLVSGRIYKEYIAVCAGTPRVQVIDVPLGNHSTDKRRAAVRPDDPNARSALTTILKVVPRGIYAEVHVRADRATRHQVRVHLAWVGHPLVGDAIYGGPHCELVPRHLLHASRLSFDWGYEKIDVCAPLPDDIQAFLAKSESQISPGSD